MKSYFTRYIISNQRKTRFVVEKDVASSYVSYAKEFDTPMDAYHFMSHSSDLKGLNSVIPIKIVAEV